MRTPPSPRNLKEWISVLIVTAIIVAVGVLTLNPPWAGASVGRIVWPAGGVALAAVVLGGWRFWPAIPLGAALVTGITGGHPFHIAATVVGNSLETFLVCALFLRFRGDWRLRRVRDVVLLVSIGLVGGAASALFGTLGLSWTTSMSSDTLARVWWFWTLGHAMGVTVFAPPILLFREGLALIRSERRVGEAVFVLAGLMAVGPIALQSRPDMPLEYLPFPLLIWAAARFRQPGAAAANLVVAGLALLWTALGWGPFTRGSTTFNYLNAWCYANVTAVSALIFAAVVTQAKEAKEEVKQRGDAYRFLIEQAPDGVLIFNAEGRCLEANPSAADLLRCHGGQLRNVRLSDLVSDSENSAEAIDELQPGASAVFSWTMMRFDGTRFPAEVSVKRFVDGRIQAFVRDVADRHELQEQLLRSQKLRALGQMAGGLAHEFNNILTVILSYTTIAKQALPPSNRANRDLDNVINAAERASGLTRQLLAFGRRQPVDAQVISVNDLLSDMSTILRRVMGANIQVVILPSADAWRVKADPGQLQQVIFNLAINARDAMTKGGSLILECHNVVRSETAPGKDPGDRVCVRVTDTGAGIPSEILPHIFEPFFTTKKRSEGSGLGLAVSYAIVERAGGDLEVHSESGKGATFEISLPRTLEPAPAGASGDDDDNAQSELASQHTVLLIEDEDPLRDLLSDLLSRRGFQVLTAGDGEEAIEVAANLKGPLDLIVSDVMLPGMSGPEAAKQIRTRRPAVRVLYVSGYTEDRIASDEMATHTAAFLSKPFKPAELVTAVHAIMADRVAQGRLS